MNADMDLKAFLDYVHLIGMTVDESFNYIVDRLGPNSISREEMQYWYNFYRRINTVGRRCRCLSMHSLHRSTCSSNMYCCEKPFELKSENLVVSKSPLKLFCEWNVSLPTDFHGAFYPRNYQEKSCTIDGRFIIQYASTLSSFKLFDLYHKKSTPLEYKETKLAHLSKTRLQSKNAIRVCEFQMVSSHLGIALIRSNDYFENMHHDHLRNGMRPFASAICLTQVSIERGTFKFIDTFILEDSALALYNSYDRFNTLIGTRFKTNEPLGLIASRENDQKLLQFQVVDDRLKIGPIVDLVPRGRQNMAENDEEEINFMVVQNHQNRGAIMEINLLGRGREFFRNRRRHPILTMHTCTATKFYGFEYDTQQLNTVGIYGTRHVKLFLGKILVYDLEQHSWESIPIETPFRDGNLFVLNHLTMAWRWVGNQLYCAAELEPNRTFILSFDFNTLRWTKMDLYFLDQVYNIVTNYEGAIFAETRHKVIYGGRSFDVFRRGQPREEAVEIKEDCKNYAFYRLPVGEPPMLLTLSFLICRQMKEENPESKVAKVLDKMFFNKSHACPSKLKQIPVPAPTRYRPRAGVIQARLNNPQRNQARNIPPLRRSDRLRNARQGRVRPGNA